MKRTLTAMVAALGAVAAMTQAAPAQAAPAGKHHAAHRVAPRYAKHITSAAKSADITPSGGGYMGWKAAGRTAARSDAPQGRALAAASQVAGIDVSSYQGNVNWSQWWGYGNRFAYVKATEGTYYTNASFSQQYTGSYNQGFIRGSYHFANPSSSGGKAQADYFVAHGGGWSGDGKTLPGVLDIEYNPYGSTCYGLSAASMVSWIKAFTTEYKAKTGRDAVIYSTTDWWKTCTGNSTAFNATNPLWVARYAGTVGALPGGWGFYTFWQNTDTPIDGDLFNGTLARLQALALG